MRVRTATGAPSATPSARAGVARAVLVPYLLSRVIVVGALGTVRHIASGWESGWASGGLATPFELHRGLLAWDASWYRDIAQHGYNGVAADGLRFFPLFSMLGRAVSWLPGADAGFGVLFVANLSALALGFALYSLVMTERADADLARRAVWVVYLAPPAFVLVMGYAEATFMTFAALALLGMRSRRWWLATACAFLAGLTRPVGVLLVVPAAVEGWQRRDARAAAAVAAPVAGLVAYLLWAAHRTHDFLYPLRAQEDSTRRGHWVDPVRAVAHNLHEAFAGDHVSAGIHAVSALVFVGLLVVVARRWPLSFALYAGVALVVALSSRNLDSLERYGLATLPFVLAGADLLADPARERAVLTLTAAALAACAMLAFGGVLVP